MIEKSLELWERYGEYILMAFRTVDNVIDHGESSYVIDMDGNRLLDLASGQLCATVGINYPNLTERIVEQAKKLSHTGTQFLNKPVFEAAEKFAEVAPKPLKKSICLSTGSEANECTFRMAKTITCRAGIIELSGRYHGMTLATRSVTSISSGYQKTSTSCGSCFEKAGDKS